MEEPENCEVEKVLENLKSPSFSGYIHMKIASFGGLFVEILPLLVVWAG